MGTPVLISLEGLSLDCPVTSMETCWLHSQTPRLPTPDQSQILLLGVQDQHLTEMHPNSYLFGEPGSVSFRLRVYVPVTSRPTSFCLSCKTILGCCFARQSCLIPHARSIPLPHLWPCHAVMVYRSRPLAGLCLYQMGP